MAELITLARPYANAAFAIAQDTGTLDEWSEMLAFASAVASDPQVKLLVAHPTLPDEQKASAFADFCEGKLSEQGRNFIALLAENKRLPLLPEINALFEGLRAKLESSVNVEMASPFDVSNDEEAKLVEALSRKLGRKVNLSTTTDKSLIGGVVIRAGDVVIDASVRGRLEKLAEAIGS
ncbi:F0F1 ATP synthase subunit delta [Marinobacter halodurans]|uniref:ATP synthase subunit delta n=1 Tax=Marinobacter halodurans TaxID=2528979 RepID=A0ABY1ZL30_9GAMM|nr:F0F1 ATP synthase subunit delta [Marinobacter halodurans]TBW56438.1 F0F1 ATP synthase subunit delta [Marinobacter halodurans]